MPHSTVQRILITAGCMLACLAPVLATDHIARPYDWTLELKTKQLPHAFEYRDSHLHGVEKVRVSYTHTTDASHPEPHPVDYESLWYHQGKPIGLERHHKFEVTRGDTCSILVSHDGSAATNDECKAAANAILRLIVDANLNKNAVVNVRIPDGTYERVKEALMDMGCQEGSGLSEEGRATAINLFLQTEPDPHTTAVLYYI